MTQTLLAHAAHEIHMHNDTKVALALVMIAALVVFASWLIRSAARERR